METYDALIIGGGAAGLNAAQLLGRARRHTLVVDAGSPRNRFAAHMHGVLGHDGVDPLDLLARGRAELGAYADHVEVRTGRATVLEAGADSVLVAVEGTEVRTRALVLATGMSDELPEIPGLAEHWGSRILHCPYCHGWEVRGRHLGVLATSPLSLHQVLLVRQWTDHLTVFAADLGDLDEQTEVRLAARGIRVVEAEVVRVDDTGADGLRIGLADGGHVDLDALFTSGTPVPHDAPVAHLGLDRTQNPWGSFLTVDPQQRTSHPRIWAAGNVVNPGATVPVAMAAGVTAAGSVNLALVTEDFDHALVGFATDSVAESADQPAAGAATV